MVDLDFSQGNSFDELLLDLDENKNEDYSKYIEFIKEKYFYLDENSGEKDYTPSAKLKNVHWGQLKLFLSEFFVFIYDLEEDVRDILYIGAANGSHIKVLAEFFKEYTFHLYDSGTFYPGLYKIKNIKIYKKYFSNTDLENWKKINKKIFLISDIRTLTYHTTNYSKGDHDTKKNEDTVWGDMKLQEKWVEQLNPSVALLKFRLPFAYDFALKKGKFKKYLDGRVCFQVYQKPSSSETRLLVKGVSYKDWDILEYEKKCFYHNSVMRNKFKFLNPINGKKEEIFPEKGLFNDYDSTYFTVLVIDFIKKIKQTPTEKNVKKLINYIIENCTPGDISLNYKRAGF
jgi:hypothetical protein